MTSTGDGGFTILERVVSEEARLYDAARAKVLQARATHKEPGDVAGEAARWAKKAAKRRERLLRREVRLSVDLKRGVQVAEAQPANSEASDAVGDGDPMKITVAAGGADAVPSAEKCTEAIVGVEVTAKASRSRRRFEKRVAKAQAKQRRALAGRNQASGYPAQVYYAYSEHRRTSGQAKVIAEPEARAKGYALPTVSPALLKSAKKKPAKAYVYQSGSSYESPGVKVEDGESRQVGKLRAVQAPSLNLLPTATVKIQGQWKPVKIDTGAQYSVAGKAWQYFGERLPLPPPVDYMEGFSGACVRVLGMWRFHFKTQYQQAMSVDALVVDHDTDDFLVGEDWMYYNGVKIDFVSSEMKWYDDGVKSVLPFVGVGTSEQRGARAAKVRLVRKAKVCTQTVHHVEVTVPAADGTVGVFVPRGRKEPHLIVAPTVVTVKDGKAVVPIMNLVGRTSKLPSKETLGTWIPARGELEILELNGELDRERVRVWLQELCTTTKPLSKEEELVIGDMDQEDKDLTLALLRNYPSLLEPKKGCPPATTLGVVHHINTGSEPPMKVRPRRHSRVEHETIDGEVDEMLNHGVVEKGTGAWGSPVVLVRKKKGSVRFCVDYRMLNAVTKKDIYLLPRIDEALESMHGARRFISLDLHAGYWQVPVAEEDKDKTGFVTRQGLFRFVRMPFGLANAPGTFQRMMDAVLRCLAWIRCLVYLDDVIVFSNGTVSRHIVELTVVLDRLAQAGLSLKSKKCSFAMERLEYLGYELDAEGIRPMTTLVESVRKFPVPQDAVEVRRFVHLVGYYRRFVPNFGTKAAPMTKLLRNKVDWQWGPEQQAAFDQLKDELTKRRC